MKMRKLSGGRIELTDSVARWAERPTRYSDGYENDAVEPLQLRAPRGTSCRVRVGYEGVLVIGTSVRPDDMRSGDDRLSAHLWADEDGVPGNSDRNLCRMHGWRGTTNDWHVSACGWRRVESVKTYRKGRAWRVVLSADLRGDQE